MRRFALLLLISLIASSHSWAATSSSTKTKAQKVKKCHFPKSRKIAPEWVCDQSKENLALSAVGYSPKSRAGLEFMKDMATADARSKIASKAHADIRKKIAEQEQSAGSSPSKLDNAKIEKLTQTTLEGSKIIKSTTAPRGSLYVLVGLDEEHAQKLYESVASQYLEKK